MNDKVKENKEFLSAAAAVYAWVSAVDGSTTNLEMAKFVDYLLSLDYVDEISDADFENMYVELVGAFEDNFEDGKARAESRIETFNGDLQKSKELLRIARLAVVADEKLSDPEEAAVQEIALLLDLDEAGVE